MKATVESRSSTAGSPTPAGSRGNQLVANVALEFRLAEPRLGRPAAGRQLLQSRFHLRRRLGTELGRGLRDDDFIRARVREPRFDVSPKDPADDQQNQKEDEKAQTFEELPEDTHVDRLRPESGKEEKLALCAAGVIGAARQPAGGDFGVPCSAGEKFAPHQ